MSSSAGPGETRGGSQGGSSAADSLRHGIRSRSPRLPQLLSSPSCHDQNVFDIESYLWWGRHMLTSAETPGPRQPFPAGVVAVSRGLLSTQGSATSLYSPDTNSMSASWDTFPRPVEAMAQPTPYPLRACVRMWSAAHLGQHLVLGQF